MNNMIFATVQQIATAIRQRQMSVRDVLEAHLEHIARHNPQLGAIVTLDEAGARRRAQEADEALAQGDIWGPLHGVPITLEDCQATAGLRSTWGGFPALANHVPTEDSTISARLKAAGAILIGKTNGPAIWPDSVFARTNNPSDLRRSPGGSSSGPAAAVAAGLTPLDIGLDTFGSILNPAHYCGVYGMCPTEHRVPLTGVFFLDPLRKFRIMSVCGPMARSVADLRLVLQLLVGPDGRDTHIPPVSWREVPPLEPGQVRLAWASTFPGMPIASDIRLTIEALVRTIEQRGIQVERSLPAIEWVQQATLASQLFGLIATTFEPHSSDSPASSLEDYFLALEQRDRFIVAWEAFFTRWDALICPVGPITAPPHEEKVTQIEGAALPEQLHDIPYAISPISGCPSVILPLGRDRHGLPFGVQVLGRHWDDERVLVIAEMLSEMTGGFERPPGY